MDHSADDSLQRLKERFSAIYDRSEWGFQSGVGALPANNTEYLAFLHNFLYRNQVNSVVDFGCGDWQFSRFIDWNGINYLGIDIVSGVVERNRRIFGQEHIAFDLFQSLEALPRADLLVCKDVFQHLPNSMVQQYLDDFKRKFKFMLITNDIGPPGYLNADIEPGGWRTLQFDCPPFSEGAAIILQWTVHDGAAWWRKATYLFYGAKDSGPSRDDLPDLRCRKPEVLK